MPRGKKKVDMNKVEAVETSHVEYSELNEEMSFEDFGGPNGEVPYSELNDMEEDIWGDDAEELTEYPSSYTASDVENDDDEFVDPEHCKMEYESEKQVIKERFDKHRFGGKVNRTFLPYDDIITEVEYLPE